MRTRVRSCFCSISLICLTAGAFAAGCAHGPAEGVVHYDCLSGQRITVDYRKPDQAIVEMPPRAFVMQAASSPVGYRFVGPQLQWQVQQIDDRDAGTLFTRGNDGGPGDIAERCRENGRG